MSRMFEPNLNLLLEVSPIAYDEDGFPVVFVTNSGILYYTGGEFETLHPKNWLYSIHFCHDDLVSDSDFINVVKRFYEIKLTNN